ncbi:MAG TPA: hypothetical protein PLQ00_14360, partial [Thermoguttaceae bacterium]|nr:hypothetical protein [Thermoguttaceae bacterium]
PGAPETFPPAVPEAELFPPPTTAPVAPPEALEEGLAGGGPLGLRLGGRLAKSIEPTGPVPPEVAIGEELPVGGGAALLTGIPPEGGTPPAVGPPAEEARWIPGCELARGSRVRMIG